MINGKSTENRAYTHLEADLKCAEVRRRAVHTDDYVNAGRLIGELFAVQTAEQDLDPVHMHRAFMAMTGAYSPFQDHSYTSRRNEQEALNEAQALKYMQSIIAERMESVLHSIRDEFYTPWSTIAAKLDEEPSETKARMLMYCDPVRDTEA